MNATTQRHPVVRAAIGLAGALAVGILTATQSRVNSELAVELGDPFAAAVVSFGSGLLILLVILAGSPSGRLGVGRLATSVRSRRTPWWYLLGGVAGGFFVLSQAVTGGILGVALFTIALVSGQTISGLVVDRVGMGSMAPQPVTSTRLIGSALTLAAVGWAVSAQLRSDIPIWLLVMPFVAGIGLGWQQAANGQVRVVAESALTATVGNFVAGTTVLLAAFGVHVSVAGFTPRWPGELWLYSGGVIGAMFIGLAIVVVRRTGVLLLGLGAIAGQLLTSLTLDVVAPVSSRGIAVSTVVGTALALVAVTIAAVPPRAGSRRGHRRQTSASRDKQESNAGD